MEKIKQLTRVLPKDATNVSAYLFEDGIMFRFTMPVKVGKGTTEVKCVGRLRKPISITTFDNDRRSCQPYLVRVNEQYDLAEKTVLGIKRIEHYVKSYQDDCSIVKAGVQKEGIYATIPGVGKITGQLWHGIPGTSYPLDTGSIRPLRWTVNTLDACFEEESRNATIAFDM